MPSDYVLWEARFLGVGVTVAAVLFTFEVVRVRDWPLILVTPFIVTGLLLIDFLEWGVL